MGDPGIGGACLSRTSVGGNGRIERAASPTGMVAAFGQPELNPVSGAETEPDNPTSIVAALRASQFPPKVGKRTLRAFVHRSPPGVSAGEPGEVLEKNLPRGLILALLPALRFRLNLHAGLVVLGIKLILKGIQWSVLTSTTGSGRPR